MSELRQYHPNLRVLQVKQTKNGWIFIGDTPKDFAILQSEAKFSGKKLKCHFRRHTTLQTQKRKRFWFLREYLTT